MTHKVANSPSVRRASPGDSSVHARISGRELFGGDQFASSSYQNGKSVSAGVGVHSDDERVGMRNDGHGGGLPSRGGADPAANAAGAGPGWKSLRGGAVMSHDPPFGGDGQSSDQVTEVEPGQRRPPAPAPDKSTETHPWGE